MNQQLNRVLRQYFFGGYTASELQQKFNLQEDQIELIDKHYKFEKKIRDKIIFKTIGSKNEAYFKDEDDYGTLQPSSKHRHELIQMFNNNVLEDQILKDLDNGAEIKNIAKYYNISENYINIVNTDYKKLKYEQTRI